MSAIPLSEQPYTPEKKIYKKRAKPPTQLQKAWTSWTASLPADALAFIDTDGSLPLKFPFHKYDNLVVINQKALETGVLHQITTRHELRAHQAAFWGAVATALGVTHIGLTGPIPLDISSSPRLDSPGLDTLHETPSDVPAHATPSHLNNGTNTLRSPTSFRALYGDFSASCTSSSPAPSFSTSAADSTFWARATQHGIVQVWSPQHTMFSHGNIAEKERVLAFGRPEGSARCTAVDLYAGIGYFAFCYRRRVADVVLCWELNEWSVEGFRRGAVANGWGGRGLRIVAEGQGGGNGDGDGDGHGELQKDLRDLRDGVDNGGGRLVMFAESNECALKRVDALRALLPPVRHVNCGYLPTSQPVWESAVDILDHEHGGWIHAHENIAVPDIEARTTEVVDYFQALLDRRARHGKTATARCSHVARVKTYAPGVMHCVLDIHIVPASGERSRSESVMN